MLFSWNYVQVCSLHLEEVMLFLCIGVLKCPEFWLCYYSGNHAFTLPRHCDMQQFCFRVCVNSTAVSLIILSLF